MELVKQNNLPVKQGNAVAIYQNFGKVKAIEVRREMATMPEVSAALSKVELKIFTASTRKLIREYDDQTLIQKTRDLFNFIAKDVGYNKPVNPQDWQYTCTRLMTILKDYYAGISLSDIKLSFELSALGELDEYLPRDKNGNPDKNHYQQFNIDYFAKIINAYLARQKKVVKIAYAALPEPSNENPEQRKYYANKISEEFIICFLRYKYLGKMYVSGFDVIIYYERLLKMGLAAPLDITEDDNRIALERTIADALTGRINKYEAMHIRTEKHKNEHVKTKAISIAKRNALKASFDYMIEEGIFIHDFVKFI